MCEYLYELVKISIHYARSNDRFIMVHEQYIYVYCATDGEYNWFTGLVSCNMFTYADSLSIGTILIYNVHSLTCDVAKRNSPKFNAISKIARLDLKIYLPTFS